MTKNVHKLPLNAVMNQGYRAFYQGSLDCPYPFHTMKAKEWQRGFNRAYFNNLEYLAKRQH